MLMYCFCVLKAKKKKRRREDRERGNSPCFLEPHGHCDVHDEHEVDLLELDCSPVEAPDGDGLGRLGAVHPEHMGVDHRPMPLLIWVTDGPDGCPRWAVILDLLGIKSE